MAIENWTKIFNKVLNMHIIRALTNKQIIWLNEIKIGNLFERQQIGTITVFWRFKECSLSPNHAFILELLCQTFHNFIPRFIVYDGYKIIQLNIKTFKYVNSSV